MLAVFDYDIFIPVKVLETIWMEDDVNAEEYMDGMYACVYVCDRREGPHLIFR